jgi:hypothetical protein
MKEIRWKEMEREEKERVERERMEICAEFPLHLLPSDLLHSLNPSHSVLIWIPSETPYAPLS